MDIPSTCMATYTFKLSSDGDNSFPKIVKNMGESEFESMQMPH